MKAQTYMVSTWRYLCYILMVYGPQPGGSGKDIWIHPDSVNWKDAQRNCENCNGSRVEWDDEISKASERVRPGQNFWIGNYKMDDGSISFKGCTDEVQIREDYNTYYLAISDSLMLCQEICQGHMYFGVKHETCICFDDEHFEVKCYEEKCATGQYRIYSIGLLLRCTFDDCRCNQWLPYEPWTKMDTCFGNAGLTSDLYNKTRHKSCMGIQFDLRNTSDVASITFNVSSTNTEPKCLTFMYYMSGIRIKGLSVYIVNTNETHLGNDPVWNVNGNYGNIWKKGQIDVKATGPFKLVVVGEIHANFLSTFKSYLAIDNLTLTTGHCIKRRSSAFDCSFENDMCGWWQKYDNIRKWIRNGAASWTDNTGPERDRRSTSGYYLYAFASVGKSKDLAEIFSPVIGTTTPKDYCLRFWYFVYGKQVDALKVYKNSNGTFSEIWMQYITDKAWKQAVIDIKKSKPFVIKFEAKKNGSAGDIAIDDISLTDGRCDGLTLLDCDFETEGDVCGWMNDSSATTKWHVRRNDGRKFIAASFGKDSKREENAKLISQEVPKQKSAWFCLKFNYSAKSPFELRIQIVHILDQHTNVTNTLFTKKSFRGIEQWMWKEITIFSTSGFQIIFESFLSTKNYEVTWLYLDDIKLTIGRCINDSSDIDVFPSVYYSGDKFYVVMDGCQNKHSTRGSMCERNNSQNSIAFYNYSEDCDFTLVEQTQINTTVPEASDPETSTTTIGVANTTIRKGTVVQPQNEEELQQMEFKLTAGILGAICIVLVVVLVLLILKVIRRQKTGKNVPETIHMEYSYAQQTFPQNPGEQTLPQNNTGKQTREINSSGLTYDLACPIHNQRNESRENDGRGDDEQYVYKDMKEGAYDQIGKSGERKRSNSEFQDNTYDHTMNKENDHNENAYDAVLLTDSTTRHDHVNDEYSLTHDHVNDEYSLTQNI